MYTPYESLASISIVPVFSRIAPSSTAIPINPSLVASLLYLPEIMFPAFNPYAPLFRYIPYAPLRFPAAVRFIVP